MSMASLEDISLPDNDTLAAVLSGTAHYVYAIGRPRAGAAQPVDLIPGIDPRDPVRAVGGGDLVALVSDVSLAEFDLATLGERLQSRPWLEMLAIGHQRVMTALLDGYTLLPLKICTLYTDEGRIHELLAKGSARFAAVLDRLEGTAEWGVKLFCDRVALAAWAERGDPALRKLSDSAAAASAGARYMLEKRVKRAAQQAAEELLRSDSQAIAARLAGLARAAQCNQPQPVAVHGHAEEMTLNGAYLVGDDEQAGFAAALDDLREQYGPRGYTLELTGPWPPYSFSGDAGEA